MSGYILLCVKQGCTYDSTATTCTEADDLADEHDALGDGHHVHCYDDVE